MNRIQQYRSRDWKAVYLLAAVVLEGWFLLVTDAHGMTIPVHVSAVFTESCLVGTVGVGAAVVTSVLP